MSTSTAPVARTRSPNYPLIDLKRALDLARKIYAAASRHPMPALSVVSEVWGTSPTSSGGKQAMAALKAFGLIETDGEGAHRKVRVSDDAAKILEEHPDKAKLLAAAALRPRVHRVTWDSCAKDGELPPDATLRHFLLFDHDPRFNEAAIAGFIKQLRATISFAGVSGGIVADETDDDDTIEEDETPSDHVPEPSKERPVRKRQAGMTQDLFSLPEGEVSIQLPAKLSPRSFKHFKAWLALVLEKAEDASSEAPLAEQPDA